MFEPARLCTSERPSASRTAATIAAVVVLPLVAEISAEPWSSSAAMSCIASGSARSSSRPGSVVPPPRPRRRESERTVRAAPRVRLGLTPGRPRAGSAGPRSWSPGTSAIGSPSAYTRKRRSASTVISEPRWVNTLGSFRWLPRNTFGSVGQEAQPRDLPDGHHVQQAVVELCVGRDVHPAAVGLGVGHRHRVAAQLVALTVDGHGERRALPGGQRAQGGVEVDHVAPDHARLVGDPVGVGVEAQAGDAQVGLAVGLRPRRSSARGPGRRSGRPPADPRAPRARARSRCRGPRGSRPARRRCRAGPRPAGAAARRRPRRPRVLPSRPASAASSRAWAASSVCTVRKSAPRRRSSVSTSGRRRTARPPAAVGLQRTSSRRMCASLRPPGGENRRRRTFTGQTGDPRRNGHDRAPQDLVGAARASCSRWSGPGEGGAATGRSAGRVRSRGWRAGACAAWSARWPPATTCRRTRRPGCSGTTCRCP